MDLDLLIELLEDARERIGHGRAGVVVSCTPECDEGLDGDVVNVKAEMTAQPRYVLIEIE